MGHPHEVCAPLAPARRAVDLLSEYERALAARGYRADPAQRQAVVRLQRLAEALVGYAVAVGSDRSGGVVGGAAAPAGARAHGWWGLLGKLWGRGSGRVQPSPSAGKGGVLPKSCYLWGGVGRGKSFLLDLFYAHVPFAAKRRVHFHAFMQEVHERLKAFQQQADPLQAVAQTILAEARLICFDEFHVSDIAEAMILGRLLDALWAGGAVLVMTSNYPPDGLYPNGLMRINFLPTIERIKAMCDVIEVDGGTDYRLRTLEQTALYQVPADAASETRLTETFVALTGESPAAGALAIHYRPLPYRGCANGILWCDFAALCDGPRSQADYLTIANEYHTLLLSGVPKMGPGQASQARRFTWLVDVCYDHRVKLIVTAEAEPYDLYPEGFNAHEFARTVSRLLEMRTSAYLEEAHRSD